MAASDYLFKSNRVNSGQESVYYVYVREKIRQTPEMKQPEVMSCQGEFHQLKFIQTNFCLRVSKQMGFPLHLAGKYDKFQMGSCKD
ncbi:hypothetical protein SK128_013843, partial [Halocaridina rubra]